MQRLQGLSPAHHTQPHAFSKEIIVGQAAQASDPITMGSCSFAQEGSRGSSMWRSSPTIMAPHSPWPFLRSAFLVFNMVPLDESCPACPCPAWTHLSCLHRQHCCLSRCCPGVLAEQPFPPNPSAPCPCVTRECPSFRMLGGAKRKGKHLHFEARDDVIKPYKFG